MGLSPPPWLCSRRDYYGLGELPGLLIGEKTPVILEIYPSIFHFYPSSIHIHVALVIASLTRAYQATVFTAG